MTGPTTRAVHLFHDTTLIANLTTTKDFPEPSHIVDGVSYVATSQSGLILESDGREGWDLQVEPA